MHKYTRYDDTPRGMSWGWLVALVIAVWVAVTYGAMGPQPNSIPETTGGRCVSVIASNKDATFDWIDRLGGWVDYDGATGYWRDASGAVVGHSSAEDSDICSFV